MAQSQQNVSLTAPGFAGLNTQDSPLDMDHSFASVANNCVIDRFGRIASRKGFNYYTTNPELLNGNPVKAMGEFITGDGQTWLFVCGDNKIFIQQRENPFELVPLVLPNVPTDDNWQIVSFNDKCYFVQSAHQPLVFDPAVPTDLAVWAEYPSVTAGNRWPNCAHAAFGRLWVGDLDQDSTRVAWSGILNGENWTDGGQGSIQTTEYWPSGFDEITAMAAHNNFMVFFGQTNILLYQTTSDVVNTLRLTDTIEGLGCIGRDSVVPTGTDIMFIDATGVRSLNRTIQEKSVPIGDISMNVRQQFQAALRASNKNDIKAVFHVEDSFYACFLPEQPVTYVFDTWSPLPSGAARCTLWDQRQPRCGVRTLDRTTYFGGTGGVYEYTRAQDLFLDPDDNVTEVTQSIPMAYFTPPLDFGSAAHLIFPKQVDVTLFGGLEGDLAIQWAFDYKDDFKIKELPLRKLGNVAFWNTTTEWDGLTEALGEWTATLNNLNQLKYNIWGSGRNVKVGFTTDILGSEVSIQELNIQVLQGRLL